MESSAFGDAGLRARVVFGASALAAGGWATDASASASACGVLSARIFATTPSPRVTSAVYWSVALAAHSRVVAVHGRGVDAPRVELAEVALAGVEGGQVDLAQVKRTLVDRGDLGRQLTGELTAASPAPTRASTGAGTSDSSGSGGRVGRVGMGSPGSAGRRLVGRGGLLGGGLLGVDFLVVDFLVARLLGRWLRRGSWLASSRSSSPPSWRSCASPSWWSSEPPWRPSRRRRRRRSRRGTRRRCRAARASAAR